MFAISTGGVADLTKFDQEGRGVFRWDEVEAPPLTPVVILYYFASQFLQCLFQLVHYFYYLQMISISF
jgi:hypothetical protein